MADVDVHPFEKHKSRPEKPTDENIPLTPIGEGSTWELEREQETSFRRGKTQERRLTDSDVDSLYKELSKHYKRTSNAIHYDNFRHEGKRLFCRGRDEPLTKRMES